MSTSTNTAAVSRLANVIVPLADQDRGLEFYTETLGLEKRADVPYAGGARWIEVAPNGAETAIALTPPGPSNGAGGKETGISLQTDDIDSYHAHLQECGVDVDDEVSRFGDDVPPLLWFRDPEGNRLLVVEIR